MFKYSYHILNEFAESTLTASIGNILFLKYIILRK